MLSPDNDQNNSGNKNPELPPKKPGSAQPSGDSWPTIDTSASSLIHKLEIFRTKEKPDNDSEADTTEDSE